MPAFGSEAAAVAPPTPVFFGSTLTNIGIQAFLDAFVANSHIAGARGSTNPGHAAAAARRHSAARWQAPTRSRASLLRRIRRRRGAPTASPLLPEGALTWAGSRKGGSMLALGSEAPLVAWVDVHWRRTGSAGLRNLRTNAPRLHTLPGRVLLRLPPVPSV